MLQVTVIYVKIMIHSQLFGVKWPKSHIYIQLEENGALQNKHLGGNGFNCSESTASDEQ